MQTTSIDELFSKIPAAELAELFLSPYANQHLMIQASIDAGAAVWLVNRSDVYDETLEKFKFHPAQEISIRAKDKLESRHNPGLRMLAPPELPDSFEQISDYAVEDLLGHPLAPFEAMLFFARSLTEDNRVSAALSLTRRILEYPPNWSLAPALRFEIQDLFSKLLLEDSSPMVRSYCARIPLLSPSVLNEALKKETHFLPRAKLLQNPNFQIADLMAFLENPEFFNDTIQAQRVAIVDERIPKQFRSMFERKCQEKSSDPLLGAMNSWILKAHQA